MKQQKVWLTLLVDNVEDRQQLKDFLNVKLGVWSNVPLPKKAPKILEVLTFASEDAQKPPS